MNKQHKVYYLNKEIVFYLEYKDVKNLNLRINPNMKIYVSAPNNASLETIYRFVRSKGDWIFKHLSTFKETKSLPKTKREFVSGESIKFLGRQYRLKVEVNNKKEAIEVDNQFIILKTKKNASLSYKKRFFNNWLKEQAKEVFNKSLDVVYPLIQNEVPKRPKIEFKQMTRRWGSCLRSKHTILLNLELIKAPKHCIEYVILHELIHFVNKNHDEEFYNKLTVLMPDWKQRKEILDEEIVLFL